MMKRKRIRLEAVTGNEGLDLIARKVIMASLIYYGLDQSIVSDAQYDKWCKKLSKLWFRLDPFRQWQLGSREEIATSGFRVKVTHAAVGGARSWLEEQGLLTGQITAGKAWQWSKRHMVNYLHPSDFKAVSQTKRRRVKL